MLSFSLQVNAHSKAFYPLMERLILNKLYKEGDDDMADPEDGLDGWQVDGLGKGQKEALMFVKKKVSKVKKTSKKIPHVQH